MTLGQLAALLGSVWETWDACGVTWGAFGVTWGAFGVTDEKTSKIMKQVIKNGLVIVGVIMAFSSRTGAQARWEARTPHSLAAGSESWGFTPGLTRLRPTGGRAD